MPLITKQYKFCAAHKYWNPKWDKDKNFSIFRDDIKLHGHNYQLDVTIAGPINDDSGFIINIIDLNILVEKFVIKKSMKIKKVSVFLWIPYLDHVRINYG